MFERYTESARRALFFARYEVSEFGGTSIESEHLLLGVSRAAQRNGRARPVTMPACRLPRCAAKSPSGRASPGKSPSPSRFPSASRCSGRCSSPPRKPIGWRTPSIGVVHLLLGLLREGDPVAAAILQDHGVTLDQVRTAIETMLDEPPLPGSPEEIASHIAREIDQLQASVEALAALPADSSEARALRQRIRDRLEDLKRYFRQ